MSLAMQRAEDKTAQMQSRAQALDELMASGALDDASLPTGQRDDIQAALDAAGGSGSSIEAELTRLKSRPSGTAELESGASRAISATPPGQETQP